MDNVTALIIIFLSIILILSFIAYLIYIYKSGAPRGPGTLQCLQGQCIVERFTGIKTCPIDDNGILEYNPVLETCSDKFRCTDNLNRFAEQSDGSTNNFGLCEDNIACNCYNHIRCSNQTLSYFKVEYGNPYQDFKNQNIILQEIPYYTEVNSAGNTVYFTEPPLRILPNESLTSFCKIPNEWLTNTYPANHNLDPVTRTWFTGKFPNEPCLRGVLVYYPDDPNNFNANETLLSCMQGSPIPNCAVPYFNKNTLTIECQ